MTILFLSAANSIHTVRWVNALAERDLEIVLVSLKNHEDRECLISKKVEIIYLPVQGVKGYYLNALALKKIYNRKQFNVINVHYASGYGTLARIAGLSNILLSVWGSDVYDFPYQNILNKIIIQKNLQYAALIASTSHNMAGQTKTLLKNRKEIEVTPFGVDGKKFYPAVHKNEAETVYGIVKTLSPKYGISTVIKAFALFLKRLPIEKRQNVRLEIYGKGELLEELKSLSMECEIQNNICFRGYIPNDRVPEALRKMDIFVMGSEYESESFGVAAVEAMACGLPIIATKVAGFREVIEEKVTGYLVPVKDIDLMAEYMMKLYIDKELRERMGRNGRRRFEKIYEWNQCVDTMIEIYKKLDSKR